LMLNKDFPEDTPVFGVLLGGNNSKCSQALWER
jgi:hypothetical protein